MNLNSHKPDESSGADLELARLVQEAGSKPEARPRPEHLAKLRGVLEDRLSKSHSRRARWSTPVLVGAAMLTLAVGLSLALSSRTAVAWSAVVQAIQERPWIHGTISDSNGKVYGEQWLRVDRQVAAQRSDSELAYHDRDRQVYFKYVEDDQTIYRLPEPPQGSNDAIDYLGQVFDLLVTPEQAGEFPLYGMELVARSQRRVEREGQPAQEMTLRFRHPQGEIMTATAWIDLQTHRPDQMRISLEDTTPSTLIITFDYPDEGPNDLYDLGVPRTAKMIDRLPEAIVSELLAGLEQGRHQFADYLGFAVEQRIEPEPGQPERTAYRLWRKADKWRIDRIHPIGETWELPEDLDLTWWLEHQKELRFIPVILCDSQVYWEYYLPETWTPEVPLPPEGPGEKMGPVPLPGPIDDPRLPQWCESLLPERAGHPHFGIGLPDQDRQFLVEVQPEQGPPGTILLRAQDMRDPDGSHFDPFRFWIDPESNWLTRRFELRVGQARDPNKVAFIFQQTVEQTGITPQGYIYPTKMRMSNSDGSRDLLTHFYLDFEAEIPDELFEPLR